ncbi:hypothetical protein HMPREF9094_0982 [Fusobacterium animalis ATCC 51191]|uniref:Uncharacterized protein n=1 Tax=Fusobacterium animalis ATCC 51191 TaxID=997347 RepID=F9EM27_9FUSO|nr:hypothetical protein HMPREF9094_0982 [Fusobacterium animalis ATCC 51191]
MHSKFIRISFFEIKTIILIKITATSYNVERAFWELEKHYRLASNRNIQLEIIKKICQRKLENLASNELFFTIFIIQLVINYLGFII